MGFWEQEKAEKKIGDRSPFFVIKKCSCGYSCIYMFVFCFLFVHTVPKRAPHFDRGGCEKTQPPRSASDFFVSENAMYVLIYIYICM